MVSRCGEATWFHRHSSKKKYVTSREKTTKPLQCGKCCRTTSTSWLMYNNSPSSRLLDKAELGTGPSSIWGFIKEDRLSSAISQLAYDIILMRDCRDIFFALLKKAYPYYCKVESGHEGAPSWWHIPCVPKHYSVRPRVVKNTPTSCQE